MFALTIKLLAVFENTDKKRLLIDWLIGLSKKLIHLKL